MNQKSKNYEIERQGLLNRLNSTEWRTPIYFDILKFELAQIDGPTSVLEIGCGLGFDGDMRHQKYMASLADNFMGIEPDLCVNPQTIFDKIYNTSLEDANIEPASIDLAYSIMVMEHVENPVSFMESLSKILKPGGVYWGFTVDSRHWFTSVAHIMSHLNLKSQYLSALLGTQRGEGRYLDYPTAYKINSPEDIECYGELFSSTEVWNTGSDISAGMYAPQLLRPLVNKFEQARISRGKPRTDFVVRLVK